MLVEDHVAFREALASLLTHQSDLEVVAQAGSARSPKPERRLMGALMHASTWRWST